MKGARKNRALDWLEQAENDLLWAKASLKEGFYSQVCFICQQTAEKAMKALAFNREVDEVRSHAILEIAEELKMDEEVLKVCKKLDQYYISTRYPDALPAGAPYKFFTKEQAQEALTFAELIFDKVTRSFQK
ncbi:MAG: DNA-binding protein [Proteobacteria bacterium]|nr:MAG: DNA-binding protein [Pseudomonadota bacterium]